MPQPQPPNINPKSVADYIDQQNFGLNDNAVALVANATLDLGKGRMQRVILGASGLTLTLANPKPSGSGGPGPLAQSVDIYLKQDATGSRTLPTFSPALNYGTAGAPTLTTTASKTDILTLRSLDGGVTWLCTGVAKGF